MMAEPPDDPAVVRALYERRGLLKVADAVVRVAASEFILLMTMGIDTHKATRTRM